MLMLLCAVTAWAGPTDLPEITTDLENPIYYTIYNTRSEQPGGLMYYAGDEVGIKDGCTSAVLEDKYKFYFTGSHDALYVHNAATTKRFASVGNGNKSKGSWTDEGTAWAVGISPKGGGLAFGPQGGLNSNNCWNECNYDTGEGNPDFTTWSANDAGSIFVVELASEYTFPETDNFYTIECPLFEKVQGVAKGLVASSDGSLKWNTVDLTDKNFYWVPTVNNDGTVTLKNLGTGLYINGDAVAETGTATLYALGASQFKIVSNGTTIHAYGHGDGANASGGIVSYGGAAGSASAWSFVERKDPDAVQEVEVTYNFVYDGERKYSQTYNTLVGEQYQAITVTLPFGVSAVKPEGVISANDVTDGVIVKEIELTVNVPFEYANSYSEISQWYNMQIRDDGFTYLQYDAAKEYIPASQSAVPTSSKNSYAWAFVGDPFNGYEIVNYVAGETMVLSAPSAPTGDKNKEELARMVTKDGATGNTTWMFYNPTHSNAVENTFYVVHPTATAYAFNRQTYDGANTLCYWNGRDTGSALRVVECEISTLSEDLEALVAQANTLLEQIEIGTGLGKYSSSYENYEATYNEIVEYSQNIPATATDEDIQEKIDELQAIIASFSLNMPVAGKYYRIKSKVSGLYVTAPSNTGTAMIMESGANANNIFYWDNEKHFLVYGTGMYINGKNHAHYGYKDTYTFEESKTGVAGAYTIKPATANYWHDNGTNLDVYSGATHANCNWIIEEVTELPVKVSIGYATLYAPVALAIPEGVTAHTVTLNGEWATLSEPLEVIPANTGVVLQAEANTYNFAITTDVEFNGENDLNGSIARTLVTKEENKAYYILAVVDEVAGFYNPINGTDNTKFYNGGHKAYIAVDGVAQSNSIRFGEGTTGIENVTVENGVKAIYDLTGRRVESVTAPGIYIVNGKKVLVK